MEIFVQKLNPCTNGNTMQRYFILFRQKLQRYFILFRQKLQRYFNPCSSGILYQISIIGRTSALSAIPEIKGESLSQMTANIRKMSKLTVQ
jgi:hypothetical protein